MPVGNENAIIKSFHVGYCTTDSREHKIQKTAVCLFKSTLKYLQFIQFCSTFFVLTIFRPFRPNVKSVFYCVASLFVFMFYRIYLRFCLVIYIHTFLSVREYWALNPGGNWHVHMGHSQVNCSELLMILLWWLLFYYSTRSDSAISG